MSSNKQINRIEFHQGFQFAHLYTNNLPAKTIFNVMKIPYPTNP